MAKIKVRYYRDPFNKDMYNVNLGDFLAQRTIVRKEIAANSAAKFKKRMDNITSPCNKR